MKIALIRQRYNSAGGAERFVSRALQLLSGAGADVTLIARRWKNEPANFQTIQVDPFYLGSTWRDLGFAVNVRKFLASSHFDLVQSHERIPGVQLYRAGDGVHRAWLMHRSRGKSFWSRWSHLFSPYHRYVCRAERKMFLHPNLKAVICISKLVQEEVHFHFGLPKSQLPIVYLGVDVEHFHPRARLYRESIREQLKTPNEAKVLLFVGSGFQRKGLDTMIRALTLLDESHYLWVVGRDKRVKFYQQMAKNLGVSDRVRFCGVFEDVRPYYGAADVFTMPAVYEPFGNVNMEAMACGLPILTSFTAGAADMVRDGETGWVIDALDHHAAAAQLRDCDLSVLSEMGDNARIVACEYRIEHMLENLQAVYQRLLP